MKSVDRVLADCISRSGLSKAAREGARRYSWEATALGTFEALAAEALRGSAGVSPAFSPSLAAAETPPRRP